MNVLASGKDCERLGLLPYCPASKGVWKFSHYVTCLKLYSFPQYVTLGRHKVQNFNTCSVLSGFSRLAVSCHTDESQNRNLVLQFLCKPWNILQSQSESRPIYFYTGTPGPPGPAEPRPPSARRGDEIIFYYWLTGLILFAAPWESFCPINASFFTYYLYSSSFSPYSKAYSFNLSQASGKGNAFLTPGGGSSTVIKRITWKFNASFAQLILWRVAKEICFLNTILMIRERPKRKKWSEKCYKMYPLKTSLYWWKTFILLLCSLFIALTRSCSDFKFTIAPSSYPRKC